MNPKIGENEQIDESWKVWAMDEVGKVGKLEHAKDVKWNNEWTWKSWEIWNLGGKNIKIWDNEWTWGSWNIIGVELTKF